jgi:hypothetical protein
MMFDAHRLQKIWPHIRQWCLRLQAVKICHQLIGLAEELRESAHGFAIVAFLAVLIQHPVMLAQPLAPHPPDNLAHTV